MASRVPYLSSRAGDIGDSPRSGRGFGGGGGGLLAEPVGEGMGQVKSVGEGMGQVIRGVGGLRHEEWRSATVRTL